MGQNTGLLYNKIPEAYMRIPKTGISTEHKHNKPLKSVRFLERQDEGKITDNRRLDFSNLTQSSSYLWYSGSDVRLVNIGKWHVVFQISSKHGDYGVEKTAKLIRKKKQVYFEYKNNKYFLRKANVVI